MSKNYDFQGPYATKLFSSIEEYTKSSYPQFVSKGTCTKCLKCINFCPSEAIHLDKDHIKINLIDCKGCGICMNVCSNNCIELI